MKPGLRPFLLRLRRGAFLTTAGVLVAVALVVGSLSQLLPLLERHPERVAAWLTARAGEPVAFDRISTRWTRRGPLLQLDGLRIGQPGMAIGQAEVLVSLYAGLLPGHALTELRLRGLQLRLQRADDGRWRVQGLPERKGGDPLQTLQRLGELQLVQAQVEVDAPSLQWRARLPQVDLRLRVHEDHLQAGARVWADPARAPVQAVLRLSRRAGDGELYLGGEATELADWAAAWPQAWPHPLQGRGRWQAWITLAAGQPSAVTVQADLRQLALTAAARDDGPAPRVGLEEVSGRARWARIDGGWRLDVPRLQLQAAGRRQRLDGLLLAGGQRWAMAARTLEVSALLPLLALAPSLPAATRHWLLQAHPQLRLADVEAAGERGGRARASGRLEALGFDPVGQLPGLSGLRGRFHGDAQALQFDPDPQAEVRLDWPTGFGVPHRLRLTGPLLGWRDGPGWQLATPGLRVQAADYGAELRGGLRFQGDGSRPWIDLAARLDDVAVPVARRFWIHSKMSRAAIDWLDQALVGGTVTGGQGLVVGDLDDWPFTDRNGRFEASGHIRDGRIRFQTQWPELSGLQADVSFVGNGFRVSGSGELAGVQVQGLEAGIDDFARAQLDVRAHSDSEAPRLLQLLRRSPLQADYADSLDNLSVDGPARTTFELQLPLRGNAGGELLRGRVELRGNRLADRRWGLAFEQVRGRVDYDRAGFAAPALAVQYGGRPGRLSLRAGGGVEDPDHAFEARLSAPMQAAELLDRAPELAWLRPYVHGRSDWRIGVTLPKAGASGGTPSQLELDSDLVGTRLDFPPPLAKPTVEALPTRVTVALPLEAGRVDVAFGRRLALAARRQGTDTGVRVTLGAERVSGRLPARGLEVDGHADALDALDWIGLARAASAPAPGQTADAGAGLALNGIDVQVDRLLLVGGVFADTRLQLQPQGAALQVRLAGPALVGQLSVPEAAGATVSGRLQRVWWQAAATPAPPPGRDSVRSGSILVESLPEQTRRSAEQTDPASLPPLALDVADLRFGQLALGSAVLRTHPVAGGLQLQTLQLSSPQQSINVTGQWLGTGATARTHLVTHIRTRDMGRFMQALGYGGQLRGGEGRLDLDLAWPGAPTAFTLAGLQGQLDGEVRNGQLLEVEPGAGRVLGLLSIAQLPRRMLLDFRDFFAKGLAFNRIEGGMHFDEGIARSERIRMVGPAVDITLRGQADLRRETFDQTVEVNPRSGNLLTVVGAVAGGPVGAAVGAAANAVLAKPLGEIGARTYHVTGPWKDPKVEVIDRERKPAPSSVRSPAAAAQDDPDPD